MNIFIRELKANRKALIIWSICMFLGVLSGMSKYTAYSVGGTASDAITELPSTIKALFGFGSFEVTKMSGFFAFLFLYLEVAIAIHAVLIGNGIIAKEERDKTTEFLMVKPVSRVTIITSKFLAALFNIVIVNIVTLISSIVLVSAFNKGDSINNEIVFLFIVLFVIQLIFLSIGAFLSAIVRNPKASGSLSITILLVAYIVSKITDLTTNLDILNIISPFKYFNYVDIVNGGGLNGLVVIGSLLLAGAFTALTYVYYKKRNLNV